MVLRSAGYFVESSNSIKDAIQRFEAGDYDLVLLCHTISERDRLKLTDLIKDFGSATPVVILATSNALPKCDIALTAQNEPSALLGRLDEVLRSARIQSK